MSPDRPRAIFVHPDSRGNYSQSRILRENLGIAYLSSYLKRYGFDTEIYDARINGQNPETIAQDILNHEIPVIIGLSLITIEAASWSEEFSKIIKQETRNRSPHITLGNYFPTLQPERALKSVPSADSVVLGEGEITILDLASKIASGKEWKGIKGIATRFSKEISINEKREKIMNLDTLPFPDHYATKYNLNEFAIEGSRGCYCKCTFCALDPFTQSNSPNTRWRGRTPANIVQEIRKNKEKYPDIDLYRFIDADFLGAPKHVDRVKEFIKELRKLNKNVSFIVDARSKEVTNIPKTVWRDLRDVGLKEVFLGIETSVPQIKRMMRKGSTIEDDKKAIEILENLDINVRFGWMMITPWTKEKDIEKDAQALHDLGFTRIGKYFNELNLIPGTDAIELTKKTAKIWPDRDDPDYFTYSVPDRVENLRKMGKTLVKNHLSFMRRLDSLFRDVETYSKQSALKSQTYKNNLNDLNLSLFLTVFNATKDLNNKARVKIIDDITLNIVKEFEPQITQLEKQFNLIKNN